MAAHMHLPKPSVNWKNGKRTSGSIAQDDCPQGTGPSRAPCPSPKSIPAVFPPDAHYPARPAWEERDRFILSKVSQRHSIFAAGEEGLFPGAGTRDLGHLGGRLQGHPDRLKTPEWT